MSDAWDAEDRAIARALDAATDRETAGADERLVDEYRDVLGRMPIAEVNPPAELEDRVIAAALERRPATVPSLDARRRTRRTRRFRIAALGIAAVAAVVVIALIAQTDTAGTPGPGGHISLAALPRNDIDAILRAPGTRSATFVPRVGRVAIATDGNAAVYDLAETGPVSIGLVSDGGTTVVGPARPANGGIALDIDHPERVTAVTLIRDGTEYARAEITPG